MALVEKLRKEIHWISRKWFKLLFLERPLFHYFQIKRRNAGAQLICRERDGTRLHPHSSTFMQKKLILLFSSGFRTKDGNKWSRNFCPPDVNESLNGVRILQRTEGPTVEQHKSLNFFFYWWLSCLCTFGICVCKSCSLAHVVESDFRSDDYYTI